MSRFSSFFASLLFFHALAFSAERNIIFFITDDQSPTLGCYGDSVAQTPAIDSLAKDGTLFLNAYATTAAALLVQLALCLLAAPTSMASLEPDGSIFMQLRL